MSKKRTATLNLWGFDMEVTFTKGADEADLESVVIAGTSISLDDLLDTHDSAKQELLDELDEHLTENEE